MKEPIDTRAQIRLIYTADLSDHKYFGQSVNFEVFDNPEEFPAIY